MMSMANFIIILKVLIIFSNFNFVDDLFFHVLVILTLLWQTAVLHTYLFLNFYLYFIKFQVISYADNVLLYISVYNVVNTLMCSSFVSLEK